ncbi:MAG: ABC transporter permease [Lachnospiraceae bacterium]|nr:ABC transporter permease [Candidatus Equihabitans merdae]
MEKYMEKKKKIAPFVVIILCLILWELVVRIGQIPIYVLPAPTKIIASLVTDFSNYMSHSLVTVFEALVGMLIAFLLAIALGILMDAIPIVRESIYPILVVSQTVPVIVLSPILIIYLGFGYAPKILTVVLMCFFPIVVNFSDGLSVIDEGYKNLIMTYGGSKWQLYKIAKIPSAMISLMSGLKVAATYSISGAVVGEWIASQQGLGYYLIRAKNNYAMDKVFGCVLMIILLSLLMNALVSAFGWMATPGKRIKK